MRVPAAMCGIFGLKVTHGRVPLTGVYPLVPSFDTIGPLARSVDDLIAGYLAMAGDDPTDPWTRPVAVHRPPSSVDPSTIRIGIVKQWLDTPHTNETERAIATFLDRCSELGFSTTVIDDKALAPISEVTRASRAEVLEVHADRFGEHPQGYGPDVRARLEESSGVTTGDMVAAQTWISGARAAVQRLQIENLTVLTAPTVGVRSKTIGADDVDIDGTPVFHRIPLASFTAPINAIGVPALSMPVSGTGAPPISVQLIGPAWSEAALLAIARHLESKGVVGFSPPPHQFL